jgi:alpha-beta hydrolase superfamily lysophospholipase
VLSVCYLCCMLKKIPKKLRIWLTILVVVYLLGGTAIYFFQERILFQCKALPADYTYHFHIPYKETTLLLNEKDLLSIVRFTVSDSIRKGVVLYFHGNKDNIERYAPFASNFTKNDYEVWMMDYPGYGKSTGKRTEQALYDNALELYKMARAVVSKDSIIIYGKSLGTGIATQLASVRDCKRLILETPYYSFTAVASRYLFIYPLNWLLHFRFPIYEYMPNVTAPITIFHGTDDEVIKYSNANRLKPLLKKGDEFMTIEGGHHNDLYQFKDVEQKLDSVLSL